MIESTKETKETNGERIVFLSCDFDLESKRD